MGDGGLILSVTAAPDTLSNDGVAGCMTDLIGGLLVLHLSCCINHAHNPVLTIQCDVDMWPLPHVMLHAGGCTQSRPNRGIARTVMLTVTGAGQPL